MPADPTVNDQINRKIAARLQPLRQRNFRPAATANQPDRTVPLSLRDVAQLLEQRGINVTMQQMKKYEDGDNRVPGSVLWGLAQEFDIGIDYFFDGLMPKKATERAAKKSAKARPQELATDLLALPHGERIARAFVGASVAQRQLIADLIEVVVQAEKLAPAAPKLKVVSPPTATAEAVPA